MIVVSLFGVMKRDTTKSREVGAALALSGQNLRQHYYNQPKVSIRGRFGHKRGGVWEVECVRACQPILWGVKMSDEKIINTKSIVTTGGYQLATNHTTTNQKMEGRWDEREAPRGCLSIISGGLCIRKKKIINCLPVCVSVCENEIPTLIFYVSTYMYYLVH